jgi:hypothetical protein
MTVPQFTPTPSDSTKLLVVGDDALDRSGQNKTVTINGNVTAGNSGSPFGHGGAFEFPGSAGDYLSVPDSSDWDWNSSDCSIDMYCKIDTHKQAPAGEALQIGHRSYNAASCIWAFGTLSSGLIDFYYFNGSVNHVVGTTALSTGEYHHIAMSLTESTIRLYVNGTKDAEATVSGSPLTTNDLLTIGQHNNTAFDGTMSNICFDKNSNLPIEDQLRRKDEAHTIYADKFDY